MNRGRINDRKGSLNGHSKLSDDDITEIRLLRLQGYTTVYLAEKFGVNQPHISSICNRKTWKHI